jgi:cytochrome c biogenesis protein CcmG, thiol:disulfide interchange protein DsbE
MKRALILWLPLAAALALFAVFYMNLRNPNDHVIVSHVVGKPLPEFIAPAGMPGQSGFTNADFRSGKPRLLNVFASWCLPCVTEVPMLMRLKQSGAEVDGLAVHDSTEDLAKFLDKNGNPYARIGMDQNSKAQIALGSAGVPETFIVDGKGTIIYQHIGVVTEDDIPMLLQKMGLAK